MGNEFREKETLDFRLIFCSKMGQHFFFHAVENKADKQGIIIAHFFHAPQFLLVGNAGGNNLCHQMMTESAQHFPVYLCRISYKKNFRCFQPDKMQNLVYFMLIQHIPTFCMGSAHDLTD